MYDKKRDIDVGYLIPGPNLLQVRRKPPYIPDTNAPSRPWAKRAPEISRMRNINYPTEFSETTLWK
jgi:hypothetical protein